MPSTSVRIREPVASQPVRFADAVENVTRSIPDPFGSGLQRYVGLDHIDGRDLRIRRWGNLAEGSSFTRHFQAGDVLFGKRRAYQRKAALADFEGVCSGDLLVFRAKDEVLHPRLLPYLVQTGAFVAHAMGTSAGSLSPRTRWRDLAEYRVLLPSPEVQERLVELLETVSATMERWRMAFEAAVDFERSVFKGWLDELSPSVYQPMEKVLDEVKYGTSVRCGEQEPGRVPVLRIPNVVSWKLDVTDLKWASLTQPDQEGYSAQEEDLLMVRTNGNPEYVGRCALMPESDRDFAFASYLLRLRFKPHLAHPKYMWTLFRQPSTRRALNQLIRSSAGNYNLSASGLKSLRVPVPSFDEQRDLVSTFERIDAVGESVAAHRDRADTLLLALENELLAADVH